MTFSMDFPYWSSDFSITGTRSTMLYQARRHSIRHSISIRGFTLLEILVAIIVLSIGLLGLASLQAHGLRSNHSGYLRSQATIFAYEMTDRLRANRKTAIAGSYNIDLADAKPSGSTVQDVDRQQWLDALAANLPSGDGAIACTTTTVSGISTYACTITVQWNDTRRNLETQTFTMTTQL